MIDGRGRESRESKGEVEKRRGEKGKPKQIH